MRAWTIRGSTAPEAAAVIHTDFQKGFIRAEVIGFEDYVTHGGEQGAKDAGRWRLEGKEYVVADGDVIHFRFMSELACDKRAADCVPCLLRLDDRVYLEIAGGLYRTPLSYISASSLSNRACQPPIRRLGEL